jgi:threonine aldolase
MIDLRSDTVTRPTPGMRAAMASAVVGDDVFGEDPTVQELERRIADLLGREAGLFVPSGTMANQIALQLHAHHGDEVLVAEGAHCLWYESGAAAAIAGVQLVSVGLDGEVTPDQIRGALRPRVDWCPVTRALVLENTHNRAGGRIIDARDLSCGGRLGACGRADRARGWRPPVQRRGRPGGASSRGRW